MTAKVDTDHTVSAHQTCTSVGVLFFDKGFLLVCFWVGVFCSHALLCVFLIFLATVRHSTVQLASAGFLLFLCVCFGGEGVVDEGKDGRLELDVIKMSQTLQNDSFLVELYHFVPGLLTFTLLQGLISLQTVTGNLKFYIKCLSDFYRHKTILDDRCV